MSTLDEKAFAKAFEAYWDAEGTENGLRDAIVAYLEEMSLTRHHEVALASKRFLNEQMAMLRAEIKESENERTS